MGLTANIFSNVLKVIHAKDLIIWFAKNPPRNSKGFLPSDIIEDVSFNSKILSINGKDAVTIEHANTTEDKIHLFFLHGGAYILEALPSHWTMIKKIINQSDCRITFLDYPLAPECNYKDTFNMVSKTYDTITQEYANDKFVLMGDSSGGGLAFAFNQKLIKEKHSVLPTKTILLSPWLDLSLSHPDVKYLEKKDVMLSRKLLSICAFNYANGENQQQYLLSPINGNLNDCPETLIIYSTHELFYADCEKLKNRTEELGNKNFTFQVYKKLPHDWGILPIFEAEDVVNDICEFIKK